MKLTDIKYKKININKFSIINSIFILILLFGAGVFQYAYDQHKSKQIKPSPLILPVEVVKAADLGLDSAASNLYWLMAIQYFGDKQTDKYQKMDDYIRLSNDLDPRFSYPYAFGALILPMVDLTDESIEIAKRGIKESDPDWRIPYYLAINYHTEKNDPEKAIKYFDVAAQTPGAPESAKYVAAQYGSRPDLREQTKLIWESVYENSNDEVVRERAKNYLIHYQIMDILEQAAKIYQNNFGSYPDENINLMVEKGILNYIPEDPFGFEYKIDQEGRAKIK